MVFKIFTFSCFHLNTEVVNLILTRATTYVQILSVHIEDAKSVAYVVLKKGWTTRVNAKMGWSGFRQIALKYKYKTITFRKSPLEVDFEIIGVSNQESNEDNFVVIAAVHDGNY